MSIASIIATGRSGILGAQAQIAVTSTNLTNAGVTGYTAKSASTATQVYGGKAVGVNVVGYGNSIDQILAGDVVKSASIAAYDDTIASYLSSVLNSYGTTAKGSPLESATTALQTAVSNAVTAGADSDSVDKVVAALETWTKSLNTLSSAIQSSRTTADQQVAEEVETINGLLGDLDKLNNEFSKAKAAGNPTADIEDQQRTLLTSLATHVDINYYTTSTGELNVFTKGGKSLLTSSVHELSCEPMGILKAGNPGAEVKLNGEAVTSAGGTLGALLTMRETTLPALQKDLDAFADDMATKINTVYPKLISPKEAAGSVTASHIHVVNPVIDAPVAPTDTAESILTAGKTAKMETLWKALTGSISFTKPDGGTMGGSTTTLVSRVSAIVDNVADLSTAANSTASLSAKTATALSDKFDNTYGVNVEEETAKMLVYQQSFQMTSQVITTAREMFNTLMSMMK
ncbi:flagellar hook-associated protein FlgK [Rhodospirillum rubrum]|uniref:flagellar hook-associated protein FlgK n=1 Tax=Rhodospirillum rubrum TaxID=1085 RepID=UPI001908B5BC|nr:flagellar hook-associated protein FlgK [Rhodospirillum rubrum]MBK1665050.1 flagellar hook-associated protein FlgK [Rhodospirillum rubrum]MBK1675503.1 flagellar hook-associated protein FlgK [Rhodospirillum rubrum]